MSGRLDCSALCLCPCCVLWSEGFCFGMRVTRCRESASGAGGTGWRRITPQSTKQIETRALGKQPDRRHRRNQPKHTYKWTYRHAHRAHGCLRLAASHPHPARAWASAKAPDISPHKRRQQRRAAVRSPKGQLRRVDHVRLAHDHEDGQAHGLHSNDPSEQSHTARRSPTRRFNSDKKLYDRGNPNRPRFRRFSQFGALCGLHI